PERAPAERDRRQQQRREGGPAMTAAQDIAAMKAEAEWRGEVNAKLDTISKRHDATANSITELAARKDEAHNAIYRRIETSERDRDRAIESLRTELHEVRTELAELVGKLKLGGAMLVVGASSLTAILTRLIG